MKHFAFPEIVQFRQAIRSVKSKVQKVGVDANGDAIYDSLKPLPKLKYKGTVKLHGCVHADTLVALADGTQEKIKDIKEGTSILSYNEKNGEKEFDVVKEVVIQKIDKPWIELEFDDGTILKCTWDHPILTSEGWVEAKNITPEHILITE